MKKLLSALLCLALLCALGACGKRNEITDGEYEAALTYYEEARAQYENGGYDAALQILTEAREKFGDSALYDTLEADIRQAQEAATAPTTEPPTTEPPTTEPPTTEAPTTTAAPTSAAPTAPATAAKAEGKYLAIGALDQNTFPPTLPDADSAVGTIASTKTTYEKGQKVEYSYDKSGNKVQRAVYIDANTPYQIFVYYPGTDTVKNQKVVEYGSNRKAKYLYETWFDEDGDPYYKTIVEPDIERSSYTRYDKNGNPSYMVSNKKGEDEYTVSVIGANGKIKEARYYTLDRVFLRARPVG